MTITTEEMATFCRKKGFVFPTSEIYGGLAGFFDYGPLGVELKNNIKAEWWKRFVQSQENVVGIDGSIVANPKTWIASGHTESFIDVMITCSKCKSRFKIEQVEKKKCLKCGSELTDKGSPFNTMFVTYVGPEQDEKNLAYLRPETAQLIFTNFKNILDTSRVKLPFGIAQIGKAFRNEISPRDFLFRMREFEQMEIEFFSHPDKQDECDLPKELLNMEVQILTAEDVEKGNEKERSMKVKDMLDRKMLSRWHAYWLISHYKWFIDMGIVKFNLRLRQYTKKELAHYASACFDLEYKFPFGWQEIHGNAMRGTFDLTRQGEFSKVDLSYYDEESKQRVIPVVASEPSQGLDRAFLTFLFDSYEHDKKRENVVLHLNPRLAPYKVAVFPLLSNKMELTDLSRKVFDELKAEFAAFFDSSGSIGRRYARQDEAGTPFCVTIDFDSLKDHTVTIRHRDTMEQMRVPIAQLKAKLQELINKF